MNWVYLQSEPGLWTVGFYDPNGAWHSESDHDTTGGAAARVRWLNGGGWFQCENGVPIREDV